MSTFATITAELREGVARLTLNRPDAGNAIDLAMARDLAAITLDWTVDPSVRVVVLRGAGSRFCVGGDLRSFAAEPGLPRLLTEITAALHAAIARLARMDAPIVVAVQGSAAGAGLGLVGAADIVVAAESARFVMAYTAIGLTPDASVTWSLPRLVGLRRALDLTLTNRSLTAAEALEAGLVSRIVPDGALEAATEAIVDQLAVGPTSALGAAKRLLRGSVGRDLEAQMELETAALVAAAAHEDGREGIEAFLAKRLPKFGGSRGQG